MEELRELPIPPARRVVSTVTQKLQKNRRRRNKFGRGKAQVIKESLRDQQAPR